MGYAEQKKQNRVQLLADEGEAVLLNAGAGDVARVVLIRRGQPEAIQQTPEFLRQSVQISIANDATLGVSAASLDKGTFTLKAPVRIGGTAETLRVKNVVSQDEAWIVLEMQ